MTSRFDTQQAFCKALNVPRGTRSIDIRLAVEEATTVTITYYPDDLDELVPVLKTLVLVAKEVDDVADGGDTREITIESDEPEVHYEPSDDRLVDVTTFNDESRRYALPAAPEVIDDPFAYMPVYQSSRFSEFVDRVKRWFLR